MAKAYPSCVGGHDKCKIVLTENCPFESYCKQLTFTVTDEQVKVLRALGNRIFNKPIVAVKKWNVKKGEPIAEIFVNGKRFIAYSIEEVNNVLRWFKP